ncbi:MAG TPA: sigma 54-interacting transcriptional regulator [Steroidobacter sp.]
MSEPHGRLLVYPEASAHPRPIRAKAAIFADPTSQVLLQQLDRVAPADVPVLIVGETGTGKELVARHLHSQSGRKGAFVAVNCGALTESLAEAELFGHQAGSFTGANETRAGWFEAANGGTLFLDEIGDLPLPLQVKLLRVLQEREVVRVGSRKAIPLDVRLVAATNINLAEAVSAGRFRLDLYYRLNVVTFDLPPLRERRGDVVPLVEHFLYKYSEKLRVRPPVLTLEARRALLGYAWPGNIRELENVMHFAMLTADGDIRPEHLRFAAAPQTATSAPPSTPIDTIGAQLDKLFASTPVELYQSLEELIVRRAFAYCSHNQVQTARLLGISRNVLRTLLKRIGLLTNDAAADEYPDLRLVSPAETSRAVI